MISIDEHPQPQQQQLLSYEAFASVSDIDLLKPNTTDDANLDDTNYQLSNFSIRDYVFGSRCKDIACNWPFSSKTLQLCMNSGVKNLLPPFQSLDSSVRKCVFDKCLPAEETVGDDDEILANRMSNNKSTFVSSEKMVKNCKFIMKLNSGVRPVIEEVTQNNFVDKEITSKVCPVCKTFISSSNTTLNAHIDRCLSEKSSMKRTAKVMVKHKVKPRKMRLMVDIYKTALHCTIEELDRRNGTSWTTDSSFHDQEIDEFRAEEEDEEKKEEPQEANFGPEIDGHEDHEGAVYVDTNGKKVRILSMPKVSNVNDLEARKLRKGGNGSKKKAYGKKNHQKLISNSKKVGKKIADKPGTSGQEGCNKDARVEKRVAITRPPWACSKRTDLSKKRFDVLSKPKGGEEIPSLQKKLISASQEDDTRSSKFSLKRKFSGDENCLSTDDDDDISSPSQDSSKKSRMEEGDHINTDDEKLCFEIENTSSNGDESSGGLEITSESAKTDEVPFQSGYGMENFMGLKNSNDDFLSQMSNTFDLQNGMDDDHIEKKGSYFEDPIPIPGPPGSFLPLSPGADDDIVSEEELQANSSLTTTSRVDQSNEEPNLHHEVMKMDFISDSPISTVSNPIFTRSASTRFQDVVNDFRSGLVSLTLSQPAPVDTLKLPVYNRDYDSVISSTPTTPVLRLMGQNLTVVNNTMFPTTTNGPNVHPKEIIVIDDSSETETDDHHTLFKQQRNGSLLEKSYSFANNTYNGGVFPVFREIVNHGPERG